MDNIRPVKEIVSIRIVKVTDKYADSISEGKCRRGKFRGFGPDFTYRTLRWQRLIGRGSTSAGSGWQTAISLATASYIDPLIDLATDHRVGK